MALQQILIDSGFLYTLLDQLNSKHELAYITVATTPAEYLIPYVTLTEAAFLFNRAGGVPAVLRFLDELVKIRPTFEPVTLADLTRAREIMAEYRDARLDFVDCCIVAIVERLNIRQIATFDQRDFSIFRLKHCEYPEILP